MHSLRAFSVFAPAVVNEALNTKPLSFVKELFAIHL